PRITRHRCAVRGPGKGLLPRDDLALVAVDERNERQFAAAPALEKARTAALQIGADAAWARARHFDVADLLFLDDEAAVEPLHQERQAERRSPAAPFGDDVEIVVRFVERHFEPAMAVRQENG